MVEQRGAPATGDSVSGAAAASKQPRLTLNTQYLKASSFEVPGAPGFYTQRRTPPLVEITLDIRIIQLQPQQPHFEVTLVLSANGKSSVVDAQDKPSPDSTPAFNCNIAYAGIVSLSDAPPDAVDLLLFIETPKLLFPAARNLLADMTRDAGITPVLLQAFDFTALHQQRRAQAA